MATISITTPSDGQTIDASDVATPLNTIVTEINGNLDSNNIAEGGVVPNSLTDGTGTSWAWQSWTPSYTNFSVGNGTLVYSKYIQIGKTVHARFSVTFGSTTSLTGDMGVSLPVSASAEYGDTNSEPIGQVSFSDVGSAVYDGNAFIKSSTEAVIRSKAASGTYTTSSVILSPNIPFTWAASDRLEFSLTYEAA